MTQYIVIIIINVIKLSQDEAATNELIQSIRPGNTANAIQTGTK